MSGNRTTRSQRKSKNVGKQKKYKPGFCKEMKRDCVWFKTPLGRKKCRVCGRTRNLFRKRTSKKRERADRVIFSRGMGQKMKEAFTVEGEEQR